MKFIKILDISIFILALFFLAAGSVRASEGTAELISTTGQGSRCFIASILQKNFDYSLIVSCRNLIYPPASDKFAYVLWTVKSEDGKPEKIGELGFGKAEFRTNKAFSGLFATAERDGKIRSPSEQIVMQGIVKPIDFLEGQPPSVSENQAVEKSAPGAFKEEVSSSPTATKGSELVSKIRRAAIIFLFAFFSLIIVVIIILTALRRLRG